MSYPARAEGLVNMIKKRVRSFIEICILCLIIFLLIFVLWLYNNIIHEIVVRVWQDPVRGSWCVSGQEITVRVDESSQATSVALEVNGDIAEDQCWLCHDTDTQHINIAELNIPLKCIDLSLWWKAKVLHLVTDSIHTYHWINKILRGKLWKVLFTNPSARAGYDTRSIFKRSLTGLNSEFSFS